MKKRNITVTVSLVLTLALTLLIITSCNFSEVAGGQNQLQTFASSTATTTLPPVDDNTNTDNSQNPDNPTVPDENESTTTTSSSDQKEDPPARTEPKAMDFTVYDADGNAVKLSDYFGKPIVLNFWASWCGPCQSEMPDFNEKYLELGDEVHFLMVNMTGGRETLASAKNFISKNGYQFPVFFDTSYNAADTYAVYSLPTTYFIDAEGYIIAKATGAISANTLQQGIDMIK